MACRSLLHKYLHMQSDDILTDAMKSVALEVWSRQHNLYLRALPAAKPYTLTEIIKHFLCCAFPE